MDYSQITKQAVDFQKTAFTNWFNAVAAMMSQSGLAMPEEARKAMESWVNTCQEGFKSFPFYAEGGFFSLGKPLVQEAKPVPAESPKPAVEEEKAAPAKSVEPVVEENAAPPQKTKPAAK